MANTLAVAQLPRRTGTGMKIAIGTVAAIGDSGSFSIVLDAAGSSHMANVLAVLVSQIGTVAALPSASGSSDGYIKVTINRLGTFVNAAPGGTIDIAFVAYAQAGSLVA